ncbi:hypothetical protein M9Y10_037885 [Tritrichomonas musculus]|uniref:Thioredoxin domain-containing protein n=1 Tax=Tritrichomonas musculus TaxID=1915356 RepID=A0ABR2K6W3_9EUKA
MIFFLLNFCCSVYISWENHSSFFDKNNPKFTFVALISDYCPHCKKIKPLLQKLDGRYNSNDIITIGIIQCDYDSKLCSKFPDAVTPSLYWIKGSIDSAEHYYGPITFSEISSYIEKKISPTFVDINSNEKFHLECQKRNESSIFLLNNLNHDQMSEVYQAQKDFQHYPIHFFNIQINPDEVKYPSLCNFYYPTNRTICLNKKLTQKKIRKFIQKHLYPVIGPISQQLINNSKETKSTILILSDEYPFYEYQFRNLSSKLPDDLISAVLLCSNNYRLCLKLIVQTGNGPKILMYNPYKRLIWYYRGILEEEFIIDWVRKVINHKIRAAGPGSGFFGFIGNIFDISRENGFIAFSFFVIIITVFVFIFICGTANSIHQRGKRYYKFD